MTVLNFKNQLVMLHCGKAIQYSNYPICLQLGILCFPFHLSYSSDGLSVLPYHVQFHPMNLFFFSAHFFPSFPLPFPFFSFIFRLCAHHFPSLFDASQRPSFFSCWTTSQTVTPAKLFISVASCCHSLRSICACRFYVPFSSLLLLLQFCF